MNFDTTPICKCQNDECGQEFNVDNIHLAVCLYGVIFLVRVPSLQENDGKGFVGLTCPKCLRTSLYTKTYQEVLQIKDRLSSWVEVKEWSVDEKGIRRYKQSLSFEPNLKYYSPFQLVGDKTKDFNILTCGLPNPGNNNHFSDGLSSYIENNIKDLEELLCSYVEEPIQPAGMFSIIYWYREVDIESLLKLETEEEIRIFPRYHYYTDLHASIDPLLRCQYLNGKPVEQAKEDLRAENDRIKEELRTIAYEKGLNYDRLIEENNIDDSDGLIHIIETNQKSMAKDPKISGEFLDVLISEPSPLGGRLLQGDCDYLWSGDLFHNNEFPNSFVLSIESAGIAIKEMRETHSKIASRVQENFTKQYVQEFLQSNLEDFLEEYESLICSRIFSYAGIWALKESYLEGLYKATMTGLSDDAPYVMKKEGKAWKIVFNSNPMSGLRRIGFTYLYHLICHPNEYFFHADLFIAAGKGVPVSKANDNVEYVDANGEPVAIRMIDDKGLQTLRKQIEKLKNELSDAKEYRYNEKVLMLEGKLQQTEKFLAQVYDRKKNKIRYIKDANAKKVTDSVGKAIKRALEDIQQEDLNAYQHFSNAIGINNLYQDSLMYRPAPEKEINWITIG